MANVNEFQKWLVGVDKSKYSETAFTMALKNMNRDLDHLYLVHVSPQVEGFLSSLSSKKEIDRMKAKTNEESTQILARYHLNAIENGVKNVFLLNVSANHVGESLCTICKSKNIDTLVIGRRSLNKVKRFFIGSTSDYCIRHSTCNVMISREVLPELMEEGGKKEMAVGSTPETKQKSKMNEGDLFTKREYTPQELGQYQVENVIFDF